MSDLALLHRGLEDLEFLESVFTGKARKKLPSILTESGFVAAVLREAREILRVVGGEVRKLGPRLRRSTNVDWKGATDAQKKRAVEEMVNLIKGLPSDFLPGVTGVLNKLGAKVFKDTHLAVAAKNSFAVIPTFALANKDAIEALATTTSMFFSPAYDVAGDQFRGRAQRIITQGVTEGLGTREISRDLERAFRRTGISKSYWETVAAVHTNRARSFSHLRSYAEAGVTRFQQVAVLDESTTPICEMLDGRIFSVAHAADRFNAFEDATDVDEAKEAMPFMRVVQNQILIPGGDVAGTIGPRGGIGNQISSTALQDAGMSMPPHHFRCRTTVVPVV